MKIKTISRSEKQFTKERNQDIVKVFRNPDPKLHPFEKAREYTRALNATKWDKIFAKPFLFALDGHRDGVWSMSTLPNSLIYLISGAADGELRLWNLSTRKCLWNVQAHTSFVKGIAPSPDGKTLLTCSSDKTIKLWRVNTHDDDSDGDSSDEEEEEELDDFAKGKGSRYIRPVSSFLGEHPFTGIDHSRGADQGTFATSGSQVDIWDPTRSEPVHSFTWGADSVHTVKFSPVETHVLASCASDRNIVLYDVRSKTPLKKMIMMMSTNALCWNPMEAFNFTTANEDHNCYTFDMRKLETALCVHKDHQSAVMHLDYSPTGKEFVTGSYDRTVRIFGMDQGHSREVYHTKRMQRVFAVKYSADNKYVMSGSDDTNIRMWKAKASERIAPRLARQQVSDNYNHKLKQRYAHAPDIKRISRHRHVPKSILSAKKRKAEMHAASLVKEKRRRAHSKAGSVPFVSDKKKRVIKQIQ